MREFGNPTNLGENLFVVFNKVNYLMNTGQFPIKFVIIQQQLLWHIASAQFSHDAAVSNEFPNVFIYSHFTEENSAI